MAHKFTPEQSEMILNAVDDLMGAYGNAYTFADHINDLTTSTLLQSIQEEDESISGKREIGVSTNYMESILVKTQYLNSLFKAIDDVVLMNDIG
jgi:hypothetical protein